MPELATAFLTSPDPSDVFAETPFVLCAVFEAVVAFVLAVDDDVVALSDVAAELFNDWLAFASVPVTDSEPVVKLPPLEFLLSRAQANPLDDSDVKVSVAVFRPSTVAAELAKTPPASVAIAMTAPAATAPFAPPPAAARAPSATSATLAPIAFADAAALCAPVELAGIAAAAAAPTDAAAIAAPTVAPDSPPRMLSFNTDAPALDNVVREPSELVKLVPSPNVSDLPLESLWVTPWPWLVACWSWVA